MKHMLLASTIAALLIAGPATAGDGKGKDRKGDHGHAGKHAKAVVVVPTTKGLPVIVRDAKAARSGDWKAEGRHDNGLHLGQRKQAWARGQHLPRTYLDQRYYIRDYGQYQLAAPPAGMVWVRPYEDERRFYLVQAATGIISQILGR